MNNTINFKNVEYTFIKRRTYDTTYEIYQSSDSILRVGPKEIIQRELSFQNNLLSFNFPVPKIIEKGIFDDDRDFILEEKLGELHCGQIFKQEIESKGKISNETFYDYKNLVKTFAEAQLNTAVKYDDEKFAEFLDCSHLDIVKDELPQLSSKLDEAFEKIEAESKELDFVLTHGDFNPHNIYPRGIIDLEKFAYSPLGYDLITSLDHIYFFPNKGDYEMIAGYEFSEEQYQELVDLASEYITDYSRFSNMFKVARCAFSLVKMHHVPKIQDYRYKMFESILEKYMSDKPINLKEIREIVISELRK